MNWLKFLLTKLAQQGSINYLLKSNPNLFKEYQEKKQNIVIPEVYSGEAGEILKKWIFYRSKQGDNINLNGLDVILVSPLDKAKSWFNRPNFSFQDLINKNEEYHNQLKETKNRVYTPKYPISILKQYSNGLAWGRLETGFCRGYGDSLGHCGNIAGQNSPTQRIYTFYDTNTNIHYLTFIYHQDGILGEAKAYGNSKPPIDKIRILNREDLQSVDAQEVYKDLLLLKDKDQYIWNVIRGAGHKPENNFGFQDLNEKNKEEVKKERENIDDYFSHKKGKDSKELYFIEDGEIYFNKNITKEQFKDLIFSKKLLIYRNTYQYIIKFNLYQDKDIINAISNFPKYSYNFAEYLNFNSNRIPKEIIDSIALDSHYSYHFAKGLKFDLNKIPKEIIECISEDPGSSYAIADALNFDFTIIPKKMISSICKEYKSSYRLIEGLNFDLNKVPNEAIERVADDPQFSFYLAKGLNFDLDKIPAKIIETISKESLESYDFAEGLDFDLSKIPIIIIKGIYTNNFNKMALFEKLKDRNIKIPDWMKRYKPEE